MGDICVFFFFLMKCRKNFSTNMFEFLSFIFTNFHCWTIADLAPSSAKNSSRTFEISSPMKDHQVFLYGVFFHFLDAIYRAKLFRKTPAISRESTDSFLLHSCLKCTCANPLTYVQISDESFLKKIAVCIWMRIKFVFDEISILSLIANRNY